MAEAGLAIEVVYALPLRQVRVALRLAPGSTVADAVAASGLREEFPLLLVDDQHIGIHARPVTLATVLADGDRVELYRPLQCDPKQVRRQRAQATPPARRR